MLNKNGIKQLQTRKCGPRKERMSEEDAIARANYFSAIEGWKYRAYPCDICEHWHIGHTFPRERTIKKGIR